MTTGEGLAGAHQRPYLSPREMSATIQKLHQHVDFSAEDYLVILRVWPSGRSDLGVAAAPRWSIQGHASLLKKWPALTSGGFEVARSMSIAHRA